MFIFDFKSMQKQIGSTRMHPDNPAKCDQSDDTEGSTQEDESSGNASRTGGGDSPFMRRRRPMGGIRLPILNIGAQEKTCKFCDASYPVKSLYCPHCGAFQTKK